MKGCVFELISRNLRELVVFFLVIADKILKYIVCKSSIMFITSIDVLGIR